MNVTTNLDTSPGVVMEASELSSSFFGNSPSLLILIFDSSCVFNVWVRWRHVQLYLTAVHIDRAGQWSATNTDCVAKAEISSGVQTFLLCFCIVSACQALYFSYHCLPQAHARRRSTWEFIAVPAVEALCYGLASSSSQIGYFQLFDGRTVVWLRTVLWILTVPVLLLQIGKMSYVVIQGVEVNSLIIFVGLMMVVFGFSASLSTVTGIKWMFFFFGLICMAVVFLGVHKIMVDAGSYYISLNSPDGLQIASRIRILMVIFFFSWTATPLFWILSIEGACVVSESIIVVCFVVIDSLAKNIFGIILWDTVWNSSLEGRWTSNLQIMATEMSMLPEKDIEGSSHHGHLVPYADDEKARGIEADVVVRPGSVVPGQRRVLGRVMKNKIGFMAGSAVPLESPPPYPMGGTGGIYSYGGQNDIELSVEQGSAVYPQVCLCEQLLKSC